MPNLSSEPPKDRLLETARHLFLRDGIPSTGINTVTSRAGVARMTLYNNFASKDDLVRAVFEREAERRRAAILSAQAALDTPLDKVLALFTVALELAETEGFRGCAFINLAIETAAPDSALHRLARRHKTWILDTVRSRLEGDAIAEPGILAQQVCVLWDGGIVGAYVQQSTQPILSARDAARVLIRAALP